jgi:AcrR family transcriptional regulator
VANVKVGARISLRAERAQVTRRRIVAAARSLFVARGYGATTLEAIAAEAGVAVQTVYAVFSSKAGILRALRESVLREPEADALFERALAEPRGARKLELFAGSIRRRWEHGHDIVAIDAEAGRTDPAIRHETERVLGFRRRGLSRLVRSLGGDPGSMASSEQLAGALDALTLPEVYRALVVDHQWSPDLYEAWLSSTLKRQFAGTARG